MYNIKMDNDAVNQAYEITWTAPEYVFRKKTVDWYWWFGIAEVCLVGIAWYMANYLFIFVIIIGSFSLLMFAVRPPKEITCSATTRGIYVGGKLYSYQSIESFHIDDQYGGDKEKLLLVQLGKMTEPLLAIPLGNADIDNLHTFLLDFIQEKEIARPIGQIVMELLGL